MSNKYIKFSKPLLDKQEFNAVKNTFMVISGLKTLEFENKFKSIKNLNMFLL